MGAVRDAVDRVNAELGKPVSELLADGRFEVDHGPRDVQIVFSARMPPEWTSEIMAEVQRRGLKNPSQLIKALVREGLDRAAAGDVHDPETAETLQHLEAVRRMVIARERKDAA